MLQLGQFLSNLTTRVSRRNWRSNVQWKTRLKKNFKAPREMVTDTNQLSHYNQQWKRSLVRKPPSKDTRFFSNPLLVPKSREILNSYEQQFASALGTVKQEGRYRVFAEIERKAGKFPEAVLHQGGEKKPVTVWCSNDYLGQGQNPVVINAFTEAVQKVKNTHPPNNQINQQLIKFF